MTLTSEAVLRLNISVLCLTGVVSSCPHDFIAVVSSALSGGEKKCAGTPLFHLLACKKSSSNSLRSESPH